MARMDRAPHTTEPEVPSNDELVEEIAQGDAEALRTLYRRLSSMVYGLALRIEGNEADAEEVLVDTFYQVWSQAAQYDVSRGTVIGWILNITRSRAIDRLRSRRRSDRDRDLEPAVALPGTAPPDPEQEAIKEDERSRLREVIAQLPTDQRWAVELAYFSGLSQTQIAERLGQPLGTVKTRLRLAMEKMRRSVTGGGTP
jgi:RNA polymerase sigma-70 factor, ECF subfamily